MSEAFATRQTVCGNCGHALTQATGVRGEAVAPKPGDVTICVECGNVMIFNEVMDVRKVTHEDLVRMPLATLITIRSAQVTIAGRLTNRRQ